MAKNILHMMTPLAHMSPFDVNMAIDAGYDATVSYTNVALDEITGLVQDAMFSRSPRDATRTGVFIGGKDALLALDMLDAAGQALLKPFEISLFADPAGSFTTAAAMIAVVEKTLREKKGRELHGAAVSVFGATGVVGTASGVIAALEGALVTFVGREGTDRAARHAAEVNRRFGVNIGVADGSTPEKRTAILAGERSRAVRGESRRAGARSRSDRRRGELAASPPTSMPCRRPASRDWIRTPTARRSASAARSASARSRSATSSIEPSRAVQANDREQDPAAPRLPSGVRPGAHARVTQEVGRFPRPRPRRRWLRRTSPACRSRCRGRG